jgi:hypothetical protein
MLNDLGQGADVMGVARQYADLRPILVIDEADRLLADAVAETGARPVVAPTLMRSTEDRRALARVVLNLASPGLVHSGSAP